MTPCSTVSLLTGPAQVAEKSRWALTGGPASRAQSARWLWFATATLDLGAAHATQLLREFALCRGQGPARAAQALLALLPAELQEALAQVSKSALS